MIQRDVIDLHGRHFLMTVRASARRPIRGPRRAPARQRQMRMKRAVLDRHAGSRRRGRPTQPRGDRPPRAPLPRRRSTAPAVRRARGNTPRSVESNDERFDDERRRSGPPSRGRHCASGDLAEKHQRQVHTLRRAPIADSARARAADRLRDAPLLCGDRLARNSRPRSSATNSRIAELGNRATANADDSASRLPTEPSTRSASAAACSARLRRLELHLLAPADELKRAHAARARRRRRQSRPSRPASPACRRRAPRCR